MYETRTAHGVIIANEHQLERAKADAVDYRRRYGTHCDVVKVELVWSTMTAVVPRKEPSPRNG